MSSVCNLIIVKDDSRALKQNLRAAPGVYTEGNQCFKSSNDTMTYIYGLTQNMRDLRGIGWSSVVLVDISKKELIQNNPALHAAILNGSATNNTQIIEV